MTGLIGQKIKEIRKMNKKELENEGWKSYSETPTVIVLENGTKLYPSRDSEGNGGGVLFGTYSNGTQFGL